MPKRGTDYAEIERRLELEPDGLPARPTPRWTRNKLALLAYYLPAFARACRRAGGWYYLDGFAGNGANNTPGFPTAKGSALIGVGQVLAPRRAILIEREPAIARVLEQRCEAYREFTTIVTGDCNEVLPNARTHFGNRWIPGFCFLDPEGLELDWATVVACAEWRQGGSPYELLIYFSTPGAARTAGVQQSGWSENAERRLTRLFGSTGWQSIAEPQRKGLLEPGEAGRRYRALYKDQLRALGYTTVVDRPALSDTGSAVYHLVFATSHDAGARIMQQAMERAFSGNLPLLL